MSGSGGNALSYDNTIKLWDLGSGREIRKFGGLRAVFPLAIAPDGKTALSGSDDTSLRLWDVASGRELKSLAGHSWTVSSVAFATNGRTALSGGWDGTLRLWDLASGREIRKFEGHSRGVTSLAIAPGGATALSGSWDKTLRLWDLASGREIKKLVGHSDVVTSVAITPDGKSALSGGLDALRFWDLASGRQIRKFEGELDFIDSVALAPDGKTALSGDTHQKLKLWDLDSGREIKEFAMHNSGEINSIALAPDGKSALSGVSDSTLRLWDLTSGGEIKEVEARVTTFNSPFDRGKIVKLRSVANGREIKKFEGHSDTVNSVSILPDGKTALSGSTDGTIRLWDLQSGETLVSLSASRDGNYLAITPKGFLNASDRDTDMLAIVRGLEVTAIGQVHQSLFNPDLVREALAGDPDGEVKHAAEVINLEKVLDAGPPPAVAITSHEPGSRLGKDLVTVAARITDFGKGIGRIEWRVNGVTAGVMSAPQGAGPDYEVSQELALDPGENRIEVIAYEGRNLLASLPAQTTIVYDGPADATKPKLFVLAIGVNKYVDRGGQDGQFRPLTGSVPDAKAFGAEMEKAGAGQYESVRVTLALDEDATLGKLDEAVAKIAGEIGPRDSFVLYAAAHGYSLGGNYYMIPQDYQGGGDPDALKARAVSQERIQEWLATRIKAKKAIILLDTCESGALTGGYAKSRTEGPVAEAAVGRLHEATGRPVITAASPGKSAYENYKGHGVFTYALIEALHKGDTNNNGTIEVSELAAHVERRVPELFAELKRNGFVVKGLAAARGGGGDAQTAHFGSTGEDFSLVARLP